MRNKLLKSFLVTVLVTFLVVSTITMAAEEDIGTPVSSLDDIVSLVEKAANWLFRLFFVVAVIYILLAAFKYLRAGDNSSEVDKANQMIKNAVIAIIIALISGSFALIISNFISGS